jgi:hypothetical protein
LKKKEEALRKTFLFDSRKKSVNARGSVGERGQGLHDVALVLAKCPLGLGLGDLQLVGDLRSILFHPFRP